MERSICQHDGFSTHFSTKIHLSLMFVSSFPQFHCVHLPKQSVICHCPSVPHIQATTLPHVLTYPQFPRSLVCQVQSHIACWLRSVLQTRRSHWGTSPAHTSHCSQCACHCGACTNHSRKISAPPLPPSKPGRWQVRCGTDVRQEAGHVF